MTIHKSQVDCCCYVRRSDFAWSRQLACVGSKRDSSTAFPRTAISPRTYTNPWACCPQGMTLDAVRVSLQGSFIRGMVRGICL